MSADDWVDCPKCKKVNSVRVDGVNEYTLLENGIIVNNEIRGRCTNSECGIGFGKHRGKVFNNE